LFCTTCTLAWRFIEGTGRRGMAFHRRDRPPRHGVSSKGPAADAWRFSPPRKLAESECPQVRPVLLDCRSRLSATVASSAETTSRSPASMFRPAARLHGAPAPCPASAAPWSRGRGGDVRGEGASRVNGVHLPRRRRRAAPACELRQRATPHAHHSRRHEAVAAAAAPLFSGPALRSGPGSEPGATPALTGLQRHGGGVFTHTPPPPSLGRSRLTYPFGKCPRPRPGPLNRASRALAVNRPAGPLRGTAPAAPARGPATPAGTAGSARRPRGSS